MNSQDRVIRWYAINNNDGSIELELKNKFQDSVERSQWIRCCFSADSEYIVGGFYFHCLYRFVPLINPLMFYSIYSIVLKSKTSCLYLG